MDKTSYQLLNLLSVAMQTVSDQDTELLGVDYDKLLYLSGIHNVIPMIYQALNQKRLLSQIEPGLGELWRKLAVGYYVDQFLRTREFLEVYNRLNQSGICALVIKGIILRELYPEGEYRYSGDEDIYIRRKDFQRVDSILTSAGLRRERILKKGEPERQETKYVSTKTGLRIEVHIELFNPAIELFREMNDRFQDAFEHSIETVINGITLHTLSLNDHFLFLVLHCAKHFIALGFGIRQVCDLVIYCNTYGKEIDFLLVWQEVSNLGYGVFLLNLLKIGSRYLGLKEDKLSYSLSFTEKDIHVEALLEDILNAGVFGKSNDDQSRTGSLTLQAVMAGREKGLEKYNKYQLLKLLFPKRSIMHKHNYYCRNRYLLPVAWLYRILFNTIMIRNPIMILRKVKRSIAIGRKRIELLKEYKIIGT